MPTFSRYVLRTIDAPAARDFYARVLGDDRATIFPLHEQALARGAQPHWLGMIGVDDVTATAAALVERGATQLGPVARNADGEFTVLRDPAGAIVSVATPSAPRGPVVAWHILHTAELARATASYTELFGWHLFASVEISGELFHPFAPAKDQAPIGSFTDIRDRAGRHPHWLYFFFVPSLATSIAEVERGGGKVIVPAGKPGIAVCDDAQGAAFGIAEPGAL